MKLVSPDTELFLRTHRDAVVQFLGGSVWLAMFYWLHPLLISIGRRDETLYHSSFIWPAWLRTAWAAHPGAVLLSAALLGAAFYFRQRLSWRALDPDGLIRPCAIFLTLLGAWNFCFYDYNHYYGQAHVGDRITLGLLSALVALHPAFLAAYVAQLLLLGNQFLHPFPTSIWTDKLLVASLLTMFQGIYVRALIPRFRAETVLFMAACILAGGYFQPGWHKFLLGWHAVNEIPDIVVSSYINGWLRVVAEDALLNVIEFIRPLNPLMTFGTYACEMGGIFLLKSRTTALAVLTGFVIINVLIFAATGVLFWMWILISLAAVVFLKRLPRDAERRLFSKAHFAASLVLIFFSTTLFLSPTLAWYDSTVNNAYELEGVGASGRRYAIPKNFFSQYGTYFSQNRFSFLYEGRVLTGTYGTTFDLQTVLRAREIHHFRQIRELERQRGRVFYNEESARRFDAFLRRYFAHLEASKMRPADWPLAPNHIWSRPPGLAYEGQEPLERIEVRLIKTFYRYKEIVVYEDQIIRSIDISRREPA